MKNSLNQLTEIEKDLLAKQKKDILKIALDNVTKEHMELYYSSTYEISEEIFKYINSSKLVEKQREIVKDLSIEDIQVILSLNSKF